MSGNSYSASVKLYLICLQTITEDNSSEFMKKRNKLKGEPSSYHYFSINRSKSKVRIKHYQHGAGVAIKWREKKIKLQNDSKNIVIDSLYEIGRNGDEYTLGHFSDDFTNSFLIYELNNQWNYVGTYIFKYGKKEHDKKHYQDYRQEGKCNILEKKKFKELLKLEPYQYSKFFNSINLKF